MEESSRHDSEEIDIIEKKVKQYFEIENFHLEEGRYIFKIKVDPYIKINFLKLREEFKEMGNILPILDEKQGEKILIVIPSALKIKKSNKAIPLILFVTTIATILVDGYLRSFSPVYFDIIENYNPIMMTIYFTVSLIGIIGIHEMGHKVALTLYGIRASWPNFIPGIPGIFPTFGAVISQREPPVNRDILFDIGFAGPISGFIATLIVTFYAAYTAPVITVQQLHILELKYQGSQPFPVPILYSLIQNVIRPIGPNEVIIVSPLIWAAVVGFIITGLNLLPAWQLDGGHLARATLGKKYHRILTILAIFILFLTGYWAMALLVLFLFLMSGNGSARPLDDLSPISTKRKVFFFLSLVLAFLCLPNILLTPI